MVSSRKQMVARKQQLVSAYFCFILETSRKQKEKRILNLHNEGYSIRDMAKQEHMSFRDIGTIVQREQQSHEATEHQKQQAHIASQAYSLFLKGKSPIEVAIELELRQPEVLDLYSEYLKLLQLDKLHSVYEEVKDDIEYFVKLYKMMKASGITPPHVERLVRIADDDLPSVERKFQLANNRVTELQGDIRNITFTFQSLSDGISSMNTTLRSLEAEREKVQEEIKELYQKRMKLQGFVTYFENNNEGYLHITKIASSRRTKGISFSRPPTGKITNVASITATYTIFFAQSHMLCMYER